MWYVDRYTNYVGSPAVCFLFAPTKCTFSPSLFANGAALHHHLRRRWRANKAEAPHSTRQGGPMSQI